MTKPHTLRQPTHTHQCQKVYNTISIQLPLSHHIRPSFLFLILLATTRIPAQQTLFSIQVEERACTSKGPPSHPRPPKHRSSEQEANGDTECQPGVTGAEVPGVEDPTRKGTGGRFSGDLGRGGNDFGYGFENRGSRGSDGFIGYGCVPIASVLW